MVEAVGEAQPDSARADEDQLATAPSEEDRVRRPAELWRIDGSLVAVRAEVDQLESLDDASLRDKIGELERRWRAELVAVLPESVEQEIHAYFDWLGAEAAGPSELRIGLAQLAGWLDGLTSGLSVSVRKRSAT